jgi:gliding motility-associated-like protein
MKKLYIHVLLFYSIGLNAQWININDGGLYTYENTVVTIGETSLNNNGIFTIDGTGSLVLQSMSNTLGIEGSADVTTYNFIIDANCSVNTNLNVNGDLTMLSGIADMNNSYITLTGSIFDEREESRITSSGTGEIIKTIDLVSGESALTGNMGLDFIPGNNYSNIEVRRGHKPIVKGSDQSIGRYFRLSESVLFSEATFNYFDAELNQLDEYELFIWGSSSDEWLKYFIADKDFTANSHAAAFNDTYSGFTLFIDDIEVLPTAFSPNNDLVNDEFVLPGLEGYNQLSVKIFNRWGSVVYEDDYYQNNWNGNANKDLLLGKNLPSGTYFYILKIIDTGKQQSGYVYLKR